MSYNVIPVDKFKREAKRLVKKYPSLKSELAELNTLLQNHPDSGTPLGNNTYKIRISISSKGKGKSRALPQENNDPTPSNESSNSTSLLGRIAASASGLTQNALNPPTTSEVNQSAAALRNSGKGQLPRNTGSGSSARAESSKQTPANHGPASDTGLAGLRSGHQGTHIQQSESEFSSFLDGIDSFTPSENLGSTSTDGRLNRAWERAHSPLSEQGTQVPERTVAEQQSRDGEDVLAILSSPPILEEHFGAQLEDDENYDWGLTPEQLHQLRSMTREIFPLAPQHAAVHPDHSLNLNPSFVGETMEAREHWKEQWEGVLTRYADEVWGGLLPLVKEARLEMEEVGEEPVKEKPTAVRRLEAILGHLQKR